MDEKIKLIIETAGVRISIEAPADHIHVRQMERRNDEEGRTDGSPDAAQTGRAVKTQDASTEAADTSRKPSKGERGKSLRSLEGQDETAFVDPSPSALHPSGEKKAKNPYKGAQGQKWKKLCERLGRPPTEKEMKQDWRGRKVPPPGEIRGAACLRSSGRSRCSYDARAPLRYCQERKQGKAAVVPGLPRSDRGLGGCPSLDGPAFPQAMRPGMIS